MTGDNIQDIIDAAAFSDDLKTVIDGISSLEAKIAEANEKAISVTVDLKAADNISDLTACVKQQAEAMKDLTSVQQENRNVVLQIVQVMQQYSDGTGAISKQINNTGNEVRQLTKDLQALRNMQGRATLDSGAYKQLGIEISNVAGKVSGLLSALKDVERAAASFQGSVGNKLRRPHSAGRLASEPINEPSLTALYELEKQRVMQAAETNKKIADDEKESLDDRLKANVAYYFALYNLAVIEADKERAVNDTKIRNAQKNKSGYQGKLGSVQAGAGNYSPEERAKEIATLKADIDIENRVIEDGKVRAMAINEKFNTSLQKLTDQSQKAIGEIYLSDEEAWLQQQKFAFSKELSNTLSEYLDEEMALKDSLDRKKISVNEYNREIGKIQEASDAFLTQASLDFYTGLMNSDRLTIEQAKQVQDELNRLKEHQIKGAGEDKQKKGDWHITDPIANLFSSSEFKSDLDRNKKYLEDFYNDTINLAQESADAIKTIKDNQYQSELNYLSQVEKTVQLNAEMQQMQIAATTNYQIVKNNELSVAAEQAASEEKNIEAQKRQIALQQAKFDRQNAIDMAIINGALGVTKIWSEYSTEVPVALALTALEVGVVAAQVAKAESTPIPTYAEGTPAGGTSTPFFIAGEAGTEAVVSPGKQPYLVDKATLLNEPFGTHVIPMDRMIEYAQQNVLNGSRSSLQATYNNEIIMQEVAKIIGKEFTETGEDIVNAIYQTRTNPNVNIYAEGNRLVYKPRP